MPPGGVDRALDVGCAALVDVGEDVILVVRHHRLACLAGHDVLAADHERDRDPLGAHPLEPDAGGSRARASPARTP